MINCLVFVTIHASDLNAQQAISVKDVFIEINLENADITSAFQSIEAETEYTFSFKYEDIDPDLKLSCNFDKATVADVLLDISRQSNLKFRQINNNIHVSKKTRRNREEKALEIVLDGITVSGRVTSEEDAEGLPGVNVTIKGTTQGTVTDISGRFSIEVPDENTVLVFSSVGFVQREIIVGNQTVIDVTLPTDITALEEIVVIGYGQVKKSDLTGSVSSVKSEEIDAYPSSSVMESLVGRASGVQVVRSTGAPGPGISVRIRGSNSIEGDNDPLYVVDGYPVSGAPSNLNNSDIERIEVLKDASATAIYGSRGANGVVLITTKNGQSGKTQVDFHLGYSVQSIIKRLDLMNASEYAQLHNEQAVNDGVEPYFTQSEINSFGEGTDWQDIVFQNAPLWNSSILLNGGTEKTRFSIGGSLFKQQGIIEGSDYNRYVFRTKLDHKISEKFTTEVALNLSRIQSGRKDSGGGARGGSLVNASVTSPPTASPYNEDGSITDFIGLHPFIVPDLTNPLYTIEEETDIDKSNQVLGNAAIMYEPIEGLEIKVLGGIENRDSRNDFYQTLLYRNSSGNARISSGQFTSLLNENTVAYNRTFSDRHQFSVLAGFTYQNFQSTGVNARATGFLSDVFETYNLSAASTPGVPGSSFVESTLLSYLGRINYSFNSKYLLTISFRADGSSRFSEGNKWGYFPSGALAWRLSEEDFLQNQDFISDLKLRLSWGLTGNQAIEPYSTLNQLVAGNTIFNDDLFTTFAPGSRLPGELKWETTEQIDIGTEFGIFDSRLFITADYYVKNTRDLLNVVGLPSSLGYTSTVRNVGKVQNSGFEFGIDAKAITGPGFNWDLSAVGSFNRNEVKELAGGEDILTNNVGVLIIGDNVGILREGRPIGQFYGYLEDGYTEEGRIKYKDLNEDGSINSEDKTYIGDANPDFIFGLNSSMRYKNFQLTFFVQGTVGNDIFNVSSAPSTLDYGQGMNGPREVFTDHWTPDNTDAKYPIISRFGSVEVSDRFIEDGSYMRLKNIELAYSLPVENLGMNVFRNLQFYVSGQNLVTITGYSWWDPDVNSRGYNVNRGVDHFSYPNSKSYTFGVRAGF
jgi:TonB-linked SusC/RagA family outer membrane protein